MRDLNYELRQLCRRNRHGSFATQANRERILDQMANQLHDLGFHKMGARSLKPKHAYRLVELWRENELSVGTIKNRMSALRWWAEQIKKSVIHPSNAHYGIEQRRLIPEETKAQKLDEEKLTRIEDPYTKLSVRLQAAFGLRREESIKFQPSVADKGDAIHLKGSWTKGGKARVVPIRTEAQRQLLGEVRALAGGGALIRSESSYRKQLKRYEDQIRKAGFSKLHGLRHEYAQRRFAEIAGFECPAAGGPSKGEQSPEQRDRGYQARAVITRELGHEREQITAVYLGR